MRIKSIKNRDHLTNKVIWPRGWTLIMFKIWKEKYYPKQKKGQTTLYDLL